MAKLQEQNFICGEFLYIFNLFANEVFKEHRLRFCLPVNANLKGELLGVHQS